MRKEPNDLTKTCINNRRCKLNTKKNLFGKISSLNAELNLKIFTFNVGQDFLFLHQSFNQWNRMTQSCPNISLTQFKKPIRDCYRMMHDNRPDCCILNCFKEKNPTKSKKNSFPASKITIALTYHPASFIDNQAVIGLWKRVRASWTRFYTTGPGNMHRLVSLIISINWEREGITSKFRTLMLYADVFQAQSTFNIANAQPPN
ncbi:hypothetical protein BpHYR1_047697 [Brachionus plicatilis]|uniref:Uncharacterized protein n=1 Tax=Brachionus plicatilis TaxID=10195 RepID=A0A3M7RYE9_BRAPC|nr:hypothetical protein BpHYR1_047697 [Brachionus plicatilis]